MGAVEGNPRKRCSARIAEKEERRKRKFALDCPIISLNVEESMAEMKEVVEGDDEGMKDVELMLNSKYPPPEHG